MEQELGLRNKEDMLADNTGFLAKARRHQSEYRANILYVPYDKHGNYLTKDDALKGQNFYKDFDIFSEVKNRYRNYSRQLLANMLRSEHIPFNLFIPFKSDLEYGKRVFNSLLNDQIKSIGCIKIEYAPSPALKYLDDKTSFDAYVEYDHIDGGKGILGIEVKYTENEYKLKDKSTEADRIKDKGSIYYITSNKSGIYIPEAIELLPKDRYRQVWRNQLLGESMLLHDSDTYKYFTSMTFFPEGNIHFQEVSKEYVGLLSSNDDKFLSVTYERFIQVCRDNCDNERYRRWLDYLEERYIVMG